MSKDRDLSKLAPAPTPAEAAQLAARNRQLELVVRQRAVDQAIEVKDGLVFCFEQALRGDPGARAALQELDRTLSQIRLAAAGWPAVSNGKAPD